ncbi:hypothetical protein [Wenyingzhuangia sp. IMCC45574]
MNRNKCRLIKSDGVFRNGSVSYYKHSYVYDEQGRISIRNNTFVSPESIGAEYYRDSIIYDSRDRVEKIYKLSRSNSNPNANSVYLFYYNGNKSKPNSVNFVEENKIDKTILRTFKEEFLFYNSYDRLSRVEGKAFSTAIDNPTIIANENSEYFYNRTGNLIRVKTRISSTGFEIISVSPFKTLTYEVVSIKTQNFSNYDSNINPYQELPFINLRGVSESKNIYKSYKEELCVTRGKLTPQCSSSSWELNEKEAPFLQRFNYNCDGF